MKVIISHDIDHITVFEHYKDLIIPKHFVRNHIELFKGKITRKEYFKRWRSLFLNKWQNINEIMDFNDEMGIKTNFFIGVNNGVGLSYSLKHVNKWVPKIIERGFEVGVHGIDFDTLNKVKKEYNTFHDIYKTDDFGIRMHYLRKNDETFNHLAQAGYVFDSSEIGYKNPYKIGDMWEFPLQIMEGWVFYQGKRHQESNLQQAKEIVKKEIQKAIDLDLLYLNILFHDRYFDDSFGTWKNWYKWLIGYLKELNIEFITYNRAVEDLNKLED
jgi:hypothetical protein